jgi:hypothetical protein
MVRAQKAEKGVSADKRYEAISSTASNELHCQPLRYFAYLQLANSIPTEFQGIGKANFRRSLDTR